MATTTQIAAAMATSTRRPDVSTATVDRPAGISTARSLAAGGRHCYASRAQCRSSLACPAAGRRSPIGRGTAFRSPSVWVRVPPPVPLRRVVVGPSSVHRWPVPCVSRPLADLPIRQRMHRPRRRRSARAERTWPLILYVVSLVALPLLGFGVVAGFSIRDNAAAAATAKSFEHEVALRSAAVAATSAVQLEQLELASVAFVAEVGITAELVADVTGLDLDALGTLARRQVDAAIAHLRAVVAEVGAAAELARLDELYGELVDLRSADASVSSIDEVVMAATQLNQFVNGLASAKTPGVNVVAVEMSLQLAAIVEITQSAQDETQAMLDRFGVPSGVGSSLEAATARHDAALAAAAGVVDPERLGVLEAARRQVLSIPDDLYEFESAFDEGRTDVFQAPSASIAASANALVSRITYFVRVSTFAVAESDDLAAQASASADEARRTMRWTFIAIMSMATICVVVAFVVIRSLVRPLHRLRDAAQRIGGGQLEREDLPLEGPARGARRHVGDQRDGDHVGQRGRLSPRHVEHGEHRRRALLAPRRDRQSGARLGRPGERADRATTRERVGVGEAGAVRRAHRSSEPVLGDGPPPQFGDRVRRQRRCARADVRGRRRLQERERHPRSRGWRRSAPDPGAAPSTRGARRGLRGPPRRRRVPRRGGAGLGRSSSCAAWASG